MPIGNSILENQVRTGERTDWFPVLPVELLSTATRVSELQRCTMALGVMIQIVTNNEGGTPTLTPKILVPSAVSGDTDIAIVTFTAISASGVNVLVVHPFAADLGTEDKVAVLPREWKLELTYAGADTTHQMDTLAYARYI